MFSTVVFGGRWRPTQGPGLGHPPDRVEMRLGPRWPRRASARNGRKHQEPHLASGKEGRWGSLAQVLRVYGTPVVVSHSLATSLPGPPWQSSTPVRPRMMSLPAPPKMRVVAGAAEHGVVAGTTVDAVVAATATDDVIATEAVDDVVARRTGDPVRTRRGHLTQLQVNGRRDLVAELARRAGAEAAAGAAEAAAADAGDRTRPA